MNRITTETTASEQWTGIKTCISAIRQRQWHKTKSLLCLLLRSTSSPLRLNFKTLHFYLRRIQQSHQLVRYSFYRCIIHFVTCNCILSCPHLVYLVERNLVVFARFNRLHCGDNPIALLIRSRVSPFLILVGSILDEDWRRPASKSSLNSNLGQKFRIQA